MLVQHQRIFTTSKTHHKKTLRVLDMFPASLDHFKWDQTETVAVDGKRFEFLPVLHIDSCPSDSLSE